MSLLPSYLKDTWVAGTGPGRPIVDATTGAEVARASSDGLDLAGALHHARAVGGPALRAMTFAERGRVLKTLSGLVHEHRDALLDLSRHGGTTRSDGKFDIDGAAATLSFYAWKSKELGDRKFLLDGEMEGVLDSKRFVSQHLLTSRRGVAIHLNAFNFPAWGLAEKLACAFLAGVPVLSKPATATAPLAVRIMELWVASGALPPGALQLLVGSVGDLLDHVGPQDVVAFTGGSETAAAVRGHPAIVKHNVRVNLEADSLNAAILGPDVEIGGDTWWMFVNDVARDMTQKAGQKCTAIRRIFVPEAVADEVVSALGEKLSRSPVGDPGHKDTAVGPVASPDQHRSVLAGLAELGKEATIAWQADAAPEGGCFVRPTLMRADAAKASWVHAHEVFGPVATVLSWDGSADGVVELAARGGGGLVCSVYSDDKDFAGEVVLGVAPWHGRVHWGSAKVAGQSPGPGTVLPGLVHGGPGKAGGGEELGGLRGLNLYLQRTAIQADRGLLDKVLASQG